MVLGHERTGIVEEGKRRLALYDRFINRTAPSIDENELRELVDDAVKAELTTVVGRIVAEQVALIRPAADNRQLARMIEEVVSAHVETALEKIVAERIAHALERMDDRKPGNYAPVQEIMSAVCAATGVTVPELVGPRRAAAISVPRMFAYWLVDRVRPDLSMLRIAHAFNRDHTTVLLGIRKVKRLKDANPYLAWRTAPAVVALLNSVTED